MDGKSLRLEADIKNGRGGGRVKIYHDSRHQGIHITYWCQKIKLLCPITGTKIRPLM